VTFHTVGGIAACDMIGLLNIQIILFVTVNAFYTKCLELVQGGRGMAFPATHCTVGSQQRKPRLLVKGRDILDEPCGRCVASFAIFSQCLVVQIGMTIQAFPSFVLKYQRLMTIFAVSNPVLAHQPEL
jgi:hypothetical protein